MLLVYDRVLPSHSLPTLVGLIGIVAVLYVFQALLELSRQRILTQVGATVDIFFSGRVFDAAMQAQVGPKTVDGLQISRDLDRVRDFISSTGPSAFFDLPWMVLYIGICFAFHWMIGALALFGALILVGLTLLTERLSKEAVGATALQLGRRNRLLLSGVQNSEATRALGMVGRMRAEWIHANDGYILSQQDASAMSGGLGAVTRTFRLFLQSGVLALGAYLVIQQQATGGVIIASSILTARALAPVEQAIANLRGFIGFRQSWAKLQVLEDHSVKATLQTKLPPPRTKVRVEDLTISPPGSSRLVVQGVAFELQAGAGLAVIGASGSGKSSLIKALAGAWPIASGKVRLDGAAMDQWAADDLGPHIGYMPQNVQLLNGSVAQNIGRFDASASSETVIAAARAAGVHDLIVGLPDGYETQVGYNGAGLSAGQSQRIALARALFRDPFLVLLDEPNSNLDVEGETALANAILAARRRGAALVVIAHRPSALAALDQVLVMANGRMQMMGAKDAVLKRIFGATNAQKPRTPTAPAILEEPKS